MNFYRRCHVVDVNCAKRNFSTIDTECRGYETEEISHVSLRWCTLGSIVREANCGNWHGQAKPKNHEHHCHCVCEIKLHLFALSRRRSQSAIVGLTGLEISRGRHWCAKRVLQCKIHLFFSFSSPFLAFSLRFNMCRECDRVPGHSTRRCRNVHIFLYTYNCALHVLCSLCHTLGVAVAAHSSIQFDAHSARTRYTSARRHTIHQRLCNCLLVLPFSMHLSWSRHD